MGRDSYSVLVQMSTADDEAALDIAMARAPTARTLPRPLSELPAEIDAAFQPWIANVTPAPLPLPAVGRTPTARRPKATPAPMFSSAARARRGGPATAHGPLGPLGPMGLDDEPTIAERGAPAGLIDGKYRVEAVLGSGGMGVVVAASHVHLGTTVAIKTLRPEAARLPEMTGRFLREARAASRLRSEHVCRALDVGQMPNGDPFIVMEMLHGEDLASVVRTRGPLAIADGATYVLQACEAVAEAHALGMVHRDLKPANLMLTRRGDGSPHVKVLDFGIATSPTGDIDGGLTRADVAMGSPGYMSPEQLRSAKSVDARSDIWSLGVTLYELVSGMAPFCGDSVSAIAIAVATEEPARLVGVPAAFAAVIARCLRKPAAERYASIAELAAALAPFVHDGATRAARIASAVSPVVPPTLMCAGELATARFAATAAVSSSRRVPAGWTQFPSAPVFTPVRDDAESTQRMRRAPRLRLPVLAISAVAALAAAAVALSSLL